MTARLVGEAHADALLAGYDDGTPFDRWNDVMTDHTFFVPATRLLDDAGRACARSMRYRFDWASPLMDGALGSCHALELGFTFGTFRVKGAAPFFGTGEAAEALSDAMMDAWIAFAKTGNPSNDTSGAWLALRCGQSRDDDLRRRRAAIWSSAPNEARRKAWENVRQQRSGRENGLLQDEHGVLSHPCSPAIHPSTSSG